MGFRVAGGISGAKEIDNVLRQLPKATGKNILRSAMKESLKPFIADAKEGAPEDTGEGAKSIKARNNKDLRPVGVSTGPSQKEFQMSLQEFGTAHHAAQPFLRPAWDANVQTIIKSFADIVKVKITKSVRTLRRKAEKGTLSKRTASQFRQL